MKLKNKYKQGFTIVELLVVIVVIGILAAITIVSYSGVQNKAIVASLQSDLASDAKKMKMYYVEYGHYPSTFDTENCPATPEADTRYCLRYSLGTTSSYTGGGQAFKIKAVKNGITYLINEGSAPYPVSAPTVASTSVVNIAAGQVVMGGTMTSDGDDTVTSAGFCWGLTANPTTNCFSVINNAGKITWLKSTSTADSLNGLAISTDGKSVYAISSDTNLIHMYSRNTATNSLTALATPTISASAGGTPYDIVVSPDGKSVYVGAAGISKVVMYSRNTTTGALTNIGAIASAGSASSVVVSPDNKYVYASNYDATGKVNMYSRNTTTSALASIGTVTSGGVGAYSGLAVSPDGASLYVSNRDSDNISALSINKSTGLLTLIGNIAAGDQPYNIVISPDGKYVYVANWVNASVSEYSRDTTTGALTSIGSVAAKSKLMGLAISPDGNDVYGVGEGYMSFFDRNSETGVLTPMTTAFMASGSGLRDIVVSNDGEGLYTAETYQQNVLTFRRYTGVVTAGVPFTRSLTGQTSGQTIHYRTYAANSIGTSFSADSSFIVP